ncbi:hypothetical protein [Bifidobacterium felsineum]|uniref:Gram-positive cocci surface proteins LPxTG domain-containing protein n=1 Tax=Bifidobacterium felsineum TaxID=2045440 RepID=A0A2M9HLI9_9BIFI|nr:hypothetical protein [Bifidobacterium felsineum]PJM77680.1 hypothetical protein CSQ86_00950 [Bifidobacterium felsineum]
MKKMGKVVAVLAGLSMMLAGAGTAYADDTAGTDTTPQTTQSQQATANAQAQADAAQTQADQNDQATKDAAKTPAPTTAEKQQTKKTTKQAAPKAQAKAAAAGPAISNVEAPSTPLMYGADYQNVDKSAAFKVTLTGLTPGQPYGVLSSMNNYGDLPALGASATANNYFDPVFTASAATQTVDVFYRGLHKPSSTVTFVLISGDTINGSGDYTSLNGTVVATFGGVQVKVIDVDGKTPVTLDSQSVEDVGAHTAGLKAHYTVDSSLINEVSKICYSTTLVRIYTVSGKFTENWQVGWGPRATWDCVTNAISDEDDTTGDAYKVSNIVAPYISTQTVMGQWFSRGHTDKAEDQPNKTLPASGDIESVIPGLLANTKYGNWGFTGTPADMELVYDTAKSETTAKDPVSMIYSGIVLTFKDGSQFVPTADSNAAAMKDLPQDFTTKAAANGPVASEQLTDTNKNGVVADNNGKATAGFTYRVYVDSLKDTAACKTAIASGQYCYWTGYIYSTPKQLNSADGKASAVRVDKDGKAYVEYQIPSDTVNGDHKIALYDNDGNLLGWTPVTVAAGQNNNNQGNTGNQNNSGSNNQNNSGNNQNTNKPTDNKKPAANTNKNNTANKNQQKLSNTGSSVLVIAFFAVALLVAGASVVIYRRHQA